MTRQTTLVTLCLDLGAQTICGTLADEQGNERPFWGLLELSGALDELRAARLDGSRSGSGLSRLPP